MSTESRGKWDGLGAIVVVRQSKDEKGTASTLAQFEYMAHEFARVGLKYVDKVELDGVAASAPKRITEVLEDLFARKKNKNDFDVIAWQLEDRATRGGGDHGMWLEHEAKRHGLRVFYAGDEGVSRPYDPVVRVAKYEAAKEGSVSTGRRSRQGQSMAKKRGFYRTSGPTSFGCYRLYLDEKDKPKFIIRNLPDGRQEQLDFKTGEVIGHYGTVGKKSQHRFIKQRNEYSLLVIGDKGEVRTVRIIFYLRYKRGWRGCRIADFLNRHRVPSPKGKEWSQRQVQIIYEHEAYTGVTFNDRTFSGRFFRGDKVLGYVALNRDEIELVLKKTFAPRLKPEDEWERIDQPFMYDFLPKDVRDLAIADHAKLWHERADPTRPKRTVNAHPASDYLFSNFLRAKQDQGKEPLKGTLSGRDGSQIPYYRHPRLKRGRRKGSVYSRLIRADVLHAEVIRLLADLLLSAPDLRDRLTAAVTDQRKACTTDRVDVKTLEQEADDLRLQILTTVRVLKGAALADAQAELDRLGQRRNEIEAQLKRIKKGVETDRRPISEVVEQAMTVLRDDSERLLALPTAVVRDLVLQYVTAATVDMATKGVELMVALPSWALQKLSQSSTQSDRPAKSPKNLRCSPQSTRSSIDSWTQQPWLTIDCKYWSLAGSTTQPPCYQCRRRAA